MTPNSTYHPVAISLHWLTALALFLLLGMGWIMTDLPPGSALQFSLFQWHKSVGITVLGLTLIRLIWRLTHPVPTLPDTMPQWEQHLAHLGHVGLYAMMIGLPMIGWAVVSTSPFNIPTVLFGVLPLPHLEFLSQSPDKAVLNKVVKVLHDAGAVVFALMIVGHMGAALRHHFVLRDTILRRMLPFTVLAVCVVPMSVSAAEWNVDAAKSRLGFVGSQSGIAFEGKFARWTAKIDFDPQNPANGHALITIDMTSAMTGDPQKDLALPQADWFDIQHFPAALFEAKGFRPKGGTGFEAIGTLSIRGHGKDVVLPFSLEVNGSTAHAKGRLDLIRTDYGVGQGAWNTPQYVATEVAVVFDVIALRKN